MEKIKTDRFRSSKTAAILRDYLKNPTDSHLSRWTEAAIEDFAEWSDFTPGNKREANTLACAKARVTEGAEIFALAYWPTCETFEGRMSNPTDLHAFRSFIRNRAEDIFDMARLANFA